MAATVTLVHASPYRVVYTVVEAGTAAVAVSQNVISDLTGAGYTTATSPLLAQLSISLSNQAASRSMIEDYCDIQCHPRALSASSTQLLYDPNVSVNSFRLDLKASKLADIDTATWVLTLVYRQSIVA